MTSHMMFVCFSGTAAQRGIWRPRSTRFLDHTQRRTTVGRTPLDEWSARRRGLYLTTHNTHNRQTSMPPVEFEPTIAVGEWPQTYALDRAVTGTGTSHMMIQNMGNTLNASYQNVHLSLSWCEHSWFAQRNRIMCDFGSVLHIRLILLGIKMEFYLIIFVKQPTNASRK
jgi:hypothetical protein